MTTVEKIEGEIHQLSTEEQKALVKRILHRTMQIQYADDEEPTEQPFIVRSQRILNGEPIIVGTRTPVRAVVELWREGMAPEEIPSRLPHLTLGKVFASLSYYSDHQDEINDYIERNRIPDDLIDPLVRES